MRIAGQDGQFCRKGVGVDLVVFEIVVVFFNAFGDFAMNIMFIYYIKKDSAIAGTQSEINLEILKRFNAEKLEFAFPTQTLYNVNQG